MESTPATNNDENEKSQRQIFIETLLNRNETFTFSGLNEKAYATLEKEHEKFPKYSLHPDILIKKYEEQGFKLFPGKKLGGANAFFLPADLSPKDPEALDYSLRPRHLNSAGITNTDLEKLIITDQA